ncbi:hypothetical protein H0H92_006196 [Tricholoma furcatifolium]|nr:hypothetical protein H0H92_006196 [Tricholoma furcatifolium]
MFVAPEEEAFDEPPPTAELGHWPQGFWRQEAMLGSTGSQGMQVQGVVGTAGAYSVNPFAPHASARPSGMRGVVEGAVLRAPMLVTLPTNTTSRSRMGGSAEESRTREQGPSSSKGKGKQREQEPSVAVDAQMAGLLQHFYDVGMRIPDGINLDVFEDPVAQEAVVFLLERLERAEATNAELQQCTDELQHRVFTQANVSPPQQQPKQKKVRAEHPAHPAGSTSAAPLSYSEMAAEDSIDPQPMEEELAVVERQVPLRPRRYVRLPQIAIQWYVTGNMAVFAEGVEIPVPLTPTASFETRNNPPTPPQVRRNVYVPPKQREEGAPLFQDVMVEEGKGKDYDDDDGRSSSEVEGNYETPDESEDDATKRRRRVCGEKESQ